MKLLPKFFKNKYFYVFLCIILILIFSLNSAAHNLKLNFIDVGQGDCILIQGPDGSNILVDGGDRNDQTAEHIINYLNSKDVKKLDYIISTHPHSDHIGNLAAVLNNFPVDNVLDSGRVHTSQTYENYLQTIEAKQINFKLPRTGDQIKIGQLSLLFLNPDQNVNDYSLNNASLVFMLSYKKQKFLFTGDMEKEIENKLLQNNFDLQANLIKVPHHGSDSSSTAAFVKAVKPEIAVFQVGKDNNYGHPEQKIINRYQQIGSKIYRNDLNGDIVVSSNGTALAVKVLKTASEKQLLTGHQEKINANEKQTKTNSTANYKNKKININHASAAELTSLWGVGPATAKKIIAYRKKYGPFQTISAIKNVKGISEVKFAHWKNRITIK